MTGTQSDANPGSGGGSGADEAVRVLVVDDHELIRQGLVGAFEREPGMRVVGDAANVTQALKYYEEQSPDVVVTDLQLPDGTGLDIIRAIRRESQQIGLVVVTMHSGDEQIFAAMQAGASGFVGKDAPAEEVVAAARHAAANPRAFTARDLAGAMQRRMSAPAGPKLSPREREVLDLLVDGLAIAQIARRLYISESTAKTHVANIYEKLGAGNRAQAVMAAVRLGLVSDEKQAKQR
jgi:DNA-binding NarL/FixJ family response regulator